MMDQNRGGSSYPAVTGAVASDDALFGLVEGRLGGPGATELVPLIGATWAKFMVLTGEMLDARVAKEIGLILSVERRKDLLARARDLAWRISRVPRESMIVNKACIDRVADAMGRESGRQIGRTYDTITKSLAKTARAPDGRTFEDIFAADGTAGIKSARADQFTGSWLNACGSIVVSGRESL